MKLQPVEYHYHTNLTWIGEKKGISRSQGKPDIDIACPPEFGGHPNLWTPEDLFLASIETCTMTTFLFYAANTNMEFKSYQSTATGTVKMVGNSFEFHNIQLDISIEVFSERDKRKIERIFKHIKKACLTSNSILSNVEYNLEININ